MSRLYAFWKRRVGRLTATNPSKDKPISLVVVSGNCHPSAWSFPFPSAQCQNAEFLRLKTGFVSMDYETMSVGLFRCVDVARPFRTTNDGMAVAGNNITHFEEIAHKKGNKQALFAAFALFSADLLKAA